MRSVDDVEFEGQKQISADLVIGQ
ncbi:hypothetical protein A2U01_0114331, partial [Trifolium medium]|nr:hypothetical protein [Trifolium medium]